MSDFTEFLLLFYKPPTPLACTKAYVRYLMSLTVIFTARCYASTVLAIGLCLSVRHKSEFY